MRSFFLAATACILCFAATAYAHSEHQHTETPATDGLTLGGVMNVQSIFRNQDLENHDAYKRNSLFSNDTEVHIKYAKQADNGLHYGAVIELEADVSSAKEDEGVNADKTYLYVEGGFGRAEMGANSDAGHAMSVDPSSFAAATGGIHGDAHEYINLPERVTASGHSHINLIHSPRLPVAHEHGPSEDANKFTYYTPSISGVQAGFSYTPDSGNAGSAAGLTGTTDHHDFENVVNGSVAYRVSIGDVLLKLSASGEMGEAEAAAHHDLAAYMASANISVEGMTLGASYGNWGDSGSHGNVDDATFYALGAAYTAAGYTVSTTYLDSKRENNTYNQLSFGAEYALAPGLTPYIEYTVFDADAASATIADTDGDVMLVGMQLTF